MVNTKDTLISLIVSEFYFKLNPHKKKKYCLHHVPKQAYSNLNQANWLTHQQNGHSLIFNLESHT